MPLVKLTPLKRKRLICIQMQTEQTEETQGEGRKCFLWVMKIATQMPHLLHSRLLMLALNVYKHQTVCEGSHMPDLMSGAPQWWVFHSCARRKGFGRSRCPSPEVSLVQDLVSLLLSLCSGQTLGLTPASHGARG